MLSLKVALIKRLLSFKGYYHLKVTSLLLTKHNPIYFFVSIDYRQFYLNSLSFAVSFF